MHIYSHAASIYPLHSFLLNLHNLIHTRLYTNQVLHQPHLYTKSFLHQALLAETHFATNQLLHEPAFPQTRFSTNHLLHQPALHKRVFAHSSFYANQLFDHQLYTKHVLHQQSLPCACRPKAKGPAVCRRLLNMGSFINTTNKLHPLSPKHGRQHSCFSQPVRWRVVRFYVSCPAASFSSATAGPQLQALDRSVFPPDPNSNLWIVTRRTSATKNIRRYTR